jgi:spoIIIJ-associated protein
MHSIEVEAKSVKEAIALACEQLQTTEENLAIDVLQDTSKILSLFSGKKAKIRARLLPQAGAPDEAAVPALRDMLERMVQFIDPAARVEITTDHDETILNIVGSGGGLFIGKKGQTLESFQYLINKIRMNKFKDAPHITVDAESYRLRHIESLISLAKRLSDKAKQRKGPVTTNPLNPGDRRIIHMTLKQDEELTTWSRGEGILRKVIIAPKQS